MNIMIFDALFVIKAISYKSDATAYKFWIERLFKFEFFPFLFGFISKLFDILSQTYTYYQYCIL